MPVLVDRHKILVNLISNARQALDVRPGDRRLTLRIARGDGGRVLVEVTDNGIRIPPENLARIFNHGFTTKKKRPQLRQRRPETRRHAHPPRDGARHGATFTLALPVAEKLALNPAA